MREFINNLRKVFHCGKEYKRFFIFECIFTIIQIIVGIILPLFLAKQIVLLTDNIYDKLILVSLEVLIIAIINEINFALIAKMCYIFRRGTSKNIQIKLGREILKITQSDIDKYGTGTFIERLNQDTEKMTELFTKGVGYLSGVIVNIGIFIAIFIINKIVFIYYLGVSIILTLIYLIKTYKVGLKDIELRKQKDKVSGLTGELVKGEKDIKMLSAKENFINKLSEEIIIKNNISYIMRNKGAIYRGAIGIITQFFSFLLVLILIILIKNEIIGPEIAVVLFTYKSNIMTNFMEKISLLLEEIKNFNISSNRIFSIIEGEEFTKERFGEYHLEHLNGTFEFRKVDFSYDDYKVLDNMSFKVNAGETVAFVGKSGAGKTTIFNLLGKLYNPTNGEILIDDININTLDEDSIRNNITIISQNPYIFNMSLKDNFKIIKEDITDKEIIIALKKSCLYEFVKSLPKGLDTIVGEGGTNLSGGQRQRLAIARAFVQNTKIILFDETTSALDSETQKNIQIAINNLKGKFTIMIIAHRLSTIVNSDKIMLVEKGKIKAVGTHKELISKNKTYQQLYESELIEK